MIAGEQWMLTLSVAEADSALQRLSADADRMTDALGALTDHPGRLFLDSARLTGATAALWARTKPELDLLYERFDAYSGVLARAREVRARRAKPGNAELVALRGLLLGPSVELSSEDLPLERRNLTGPSTVTRRRTLAEIVTEMDAAFGAVTEVVVAVDQVRSVAVRRLEPLGELISAAREQAASLGLSEAGHPLFARLAALGDDLAAIQELAFGDPIALHTGPLAGGHPDLAGTDRVEAGLAAVRAELDGLVALRADFAGRLARASAAVDDVAARRAEAVAARATALDKIAATAIDPVPDPVPALRTRLDAVGTVAAGHDWPGVAGEFAGFDRAVADALAAVAAVRDTADALLGRRAELRGRLDAYRVKVARLRHSEDAELAAAYRLAHDLLWTAPCDLRAATKALVRYQQLIADRGPAR